MVLLQANCVTGQWAICDYKNDSATATTDKLQRTIEKHVKTLVARRPQSTVQSTKSLPSQDLLTCDSKKRKRLGCLCDHFYSSLTNSRMHLYAPVYMYVSSLPR